MIGMKSHRGRPVVTHRHSDRLSRNGRIILAGMAFGLVVILITARVLTPNPLGFGTHTQLGLGACGFRVMTGKPCPSCGMTTSFAWATRGRLNRAWKANPAGSIIAPACVVVAAWLVSAAISGRPRPFSTADAPLILAVLFGVGLTLSSWAIRVFLLS